MIAAVNVLWAAAFFGYAHRSTIPVQHGGEIVRPDGQPKTVALLTKPGAPVRETNQSKPATAASPVAKTNATAGANIAAVGARPTDPALAPAERRYGWQDVTNDVYIDYIARLRHAGCPEPQVRNVVVSDVNELFDKRRLEHAIRTDSPWWKTDNFMGTLPMQQGSMAANFDQERRDLLEKLLGPEAADVPKMASLNPTSVNLTGPVLGSLPAETFNTVQEVCAKSMEKHNNYMMARINENQALEPTEMAKLRDFTRTELAKVLTPEQLEEFLLRYSHNSANLRQQMRGLDLTPEELRKVFRAIDPLEHKMQLDYGGPEALSARQREQFEAQRDRAIREALSPERYHQYQLTKDPMYRQAQMTALQYGMSAKAIQPIYEMQKNMEARRLQITQNNALTPEQKAQALQSVAIEQQQNLQKMLSDQALRQ